LAPREDADEVAGVGASVSEVSRETAKVDIVDRELKLSGG
jgi:hypothetical protein